MARSSYKVLEECFLLDGESNRLEEGFFEYLRIMFLQKWLLSLGPYVLLDRIPTKVNLAFRNVLNPESH